MAIVAGIDEAGYGPVLGPLVVSGAAFELPDDTAEACLWELLAESVTRRATKRGSRLPITDSKKLHKSGAGLAPLERTALAMLQTRYRETLTLRGLLQQVAPQVLDELEKYPWYRGFDLDLPANADALALPPLTNAVRRNARLHGLRLAGVLSEPLLVGQYNRLVGTTRNKATVLLGQTLRIVQRVLGRAADQPVRIVVDRQGGRSHYVQPLLTAFEGFSLEVIEESDRRSAYRLVRPPVRCTIEFLAGGEEQHLAIALASIVSKYVRELLMIGLNRYWSGRVESLRPTAGYYVDAQRFLQDIAPALEGSDVDRQLLVRCR